MRIRDDVLVGGYGWACVRGHAANFNALLVPSAPLIPAITGIHSIPCWGEGWGSLYVGQCPQKDHSDLLLRCHCGARRTDFDEEVYAEMADQTKHAVLEDRIIMT